MRHFLKSKGAGYGGESHLLLPRLFRQIWHLLVINKQIFIFWGWQRKVRTALAGVARGRGAHPCGAADSTTSLGTPISRGARRMQPGTDCGLCWWLGASSLGWHSLFSLLFTYRWSYKQDLKNVMYQISFWSNLLAYIKLCSQKGQILSNDFKSEMCSFY